MALSFGAAFGVLAMRHGLEGQQSSLIKISPITMARRIGQQKRVLT